MANTEIDFWKRVDKTTNPRGCWEYNGWKDRDGYGNFYYKGKRNQAHRLSIELAGQDPKGWVVMHSCDNPGCVNPAHLSLGTPADNTQDMILKGRRKGGRKLILTNEQVREIRSSLDTNQNLAKHYNVSRDTIRNVRQNIFYKEIV